MLKNKTMISLELPSLLVTSLDKIANYEDMNRSSLIRKIVKGYIEDFKKRELREDAFYKV